MQRFRMVSDTCILCNHAQGTHLHLVTCVETDRLFEWLEDLGSLLNVRSTMNTEDRVYGTMNDGQVMPKGIRFFYSVLFKHMWIAYTAYSKEGTSFSEKKIWVASVRRLKTVLHAFEIESKKRFEQIDRLMHPLAGFVPQQKEKAKEKEKERRNDTLSPLGSVIENREGVRLERTFTWKDVIQLVDDY